MNEKTTINLTAKQRAVLEQTDGRNIKEIAEALGWPERNVKHHSDVLRKKFGVKARRHLIPLRDEYL